MYLCVPYGSHSKQRLFPHTALTGWALQRTRDVFPVRYEVDYYRVGGKQSLKICVCVKGWMDTCVEADSNISAVVLQVIRGDEKGT
jgi:hypothetical protein